MTPEEDRPRRRVARIDPAISRMIEDCTPQTDEERGRLLSVVAKGREPGASWRRRKAAKAARSELARGVIRYAAKIAFARRPTRLDPDEAFCEAMAGILDALNAWDPGRGGVGGFKSLVRCCCIRRMQKAKETAEVIRIPRDLDRMVDAGRTSGATAAAAERAHGIRFLGDLDPAARSASAPTTEASEEVSRAVRRGLDRLRAVEGLDVRRRYGIQHQAMTTREIADLRGRTPQSVEHGLCRARKKLRASLADLVEPDHSR